MNPVGENRAAANQRALVEALGRVRAALERYLGKPAGSAATEPAPPPQVDCATSPPAIEALHALFGLSEFERDIVLIAAGPELDARFAALCADAHDDPSRPFATFGLALAALPGAHWSALAPAAPLRRWRLVEVGAGVSLTRSALKIDERILHYLAGVNYVDHRLGGIVMPLDAAAPVVGSHRDLVARIAAALSEAGGVSTMPAVQLCGDDCATIRALAAAGAAAVGMGVGVADAGALPTGAVELESFLRLWERESALGASAMMVESSGTGGFDPARERALRRLIDSAAGAIIFAGRERRGGFRRPVVTLEVKRPSRAEQRALWQAALGPAAAGLNNQMEALVGEFSFGADAIRTATFDALSIAQAQRDEACASKSKQVNDVARPRALELAGALWDACRAQGRGRLDDLAQRIEPAATWDDLVLPDAQKRVLREIAVHARYRATVHGRWGFAQRGGLGLGISALFAGASGTGKTMAAEVLADELRLDLYRVDLSAVVSKYIGETEKNLRRVFDAAENGGAILLFDEADALFGKRSEVRDSHDRYANVEISYLLQRMEAYRGLAILTTNMKGALDQAFLRRLRFMVQFPFPDPPARAEIWRRVFPPAMPRDALDPERLAQLNVAGGNIRNLALNAAFLAAAADEPVRMRHLLEAARGEYAKLEKALSEAEIRGWL